MGARASKPYFEVLVVDGIDGYDREELRDGLRACRRDTDEAVYELLMILVGSEMCIRRRRCCGGRRSSS